MSLSPPELETDIVSKHRRYAELCAIHGDPIVERDQTSNPRSLARDIIKVEFRVATEVLKCAEPWGEMEREFSGTAYTFEKEIPKRMTMYTVFGVVSKRLGILPHRLRLSWVTDEWEFQNAKNVTANMAQWDSENSDEEETADVKVKREVPLELGTKSLGTSVDGQRVLIKVLMEQSEAVDPT
jgi:tubulin-specific chaperone E